MRQRSVCIWYVLCMRTRKRVCAHVQPRKEGVAYATQHAEMRLSLDSRYLRVSVLLRLLRCGAVFLSSARVCFVVLCKRHRSVTPVGASILLAYDYDRQRTHSIENTFCTIYAAILSTTALSLSVSLAGLTFSLCLRLLSESILSVCVLIERMCAPTACAPLLASTPYAEHTLRGRQPLSPTVVT